MKIFFCDRYSTLVDRNQRRRFRKHTRCLLYQIRNKRVTCQTPSLITRRNSDNKAKLCTKAMAVHVHAHTHTRTTHVLSAKEIQTIESKRALFVTCQTVGWLTILHPPCHERFLSTSSSDGQFCPFQLASRYTYIYIYMSRYQAAF